MRASKLKLQFLFFLSLTLAPIAFASELREDIFIRVNQVGYLENETKEAIAFSNAPISGRFSVYNAETGKRVFRGRIEASEVGAWNSFKNYYRLDFSQVTEPGRYYLQLKDARSLEFGIGKGNSYLNYQEDLVGFMRQQRCGYNPFLDMVCHQRDGRSMYG